MTVSWLDYELFSRHLYDSNIVSIGALKKYLYYFKSILGLQDFFGTSLTVWRKNYALDVKS